MFTSTWIRQLAPILAPPFTTIVPLCAIESPGPKVFGEIENPNFTDDLRKSIFRYNLFIGFFPQFKANSSLRMRI
jgi:hypothetical protein